MSRICYAPTKVDEKLGALLGVNKTLAAAIRGYYDTKMEELGQPKLNLTEDSSLEDLQSAVETIVEFRKQQKQVQHTAINRAMDRMADSYRELKAFFSAEERFNRINMIASDFSFELDRLKAKYRNASRTELCNGCKTIDGKVVGGEDTIFALIYEKYLSRYNDAMSGPHPNKTIAEKWEKVLDNWNALIPYVRVTVRQTEAIKLGNSSEFAAEADESNFSDNLLAELYNPEESTREGYQDKNELRSAYASIGKEVRRAIAETYLYLGDKQKKEDLIKINEVARQMATKGVPSAEIERFKAEASKRAGYATDDLGYLVRMNPVSTHQQLLEICKGSLTASSMISRMNDAISNGSEWLKPLVAKIQADPELQTKFRNDLHKNFQLYSTVGKTLENGVWKFRSTIKNFRRNNPKDRFYASITYGKQVQKVPGDLNSIYDEAGNFNWENVRDFIKFIKTNFSSEESSTKNVFSTLNKFKNKSDEVRKALRALGIDVTDADVQAVMNSKFSRDNIVQALQDIVEYGFESSEVGTESIRKLLAKDDKSFTDQDRAALRSGAKQNYMKAVGEFSGSNSTKLREKLDKILNTIASKTEVYKIESRVPYKDKKGKTNSLSSFINPCYLGDFIEKINGYAREKNVNGLKKFLEDKFMCSSYYGEWVDGKFHFYNKWLEELYNCDKNNIDKTFASLFSYKRFLGTASQNFEDFTSKQHALDMLTEFSFAENKKLGKRDLAWYPVFITGDSGVQRYLQAPIYTEEEILDGLYNVYQQEVQKWQLIRGANSKLREEGFDDDHLIANISGRENVYTFLPFLNKDFKGFDGSIGKYAKIVDEHKATDNEAGVKAAIKEYMKDAEANFKKSLINLGIIKPEGADNRFEYTRAFMKLTDRKKPSMEELEKAESEFISSFYYNSKFATIQQLQLMTVDPAFYKDTKDLQKRYKEIHAPGTTLDIHAIDKYNGGTFCGVDADGNALPERCVYFDEIKIDAWDTNPEFMKVISNRYFNGKPIPKDSKYGKYLENAYTDGQGYRTLESYRKVMGMAGKWDEELQRAYERLQDLRSKVRTSGRNATKQELEEMSEIMTVVFQPIKPYMYTFEQFQVNGNPGGILNIPVQHKYAEAVLIPELLPEGSQLRYLAECMEGDGGENSIDLVCSTTVVKVGSFGATSIKDAVTKEEMKEALSKGKVHKLSYSDYRIQTNVPDHFNNQSQLFGTQIRKLIMAGVELNPNSSKYNHYRDYVNFGIDPETNEVLRKLNLGDGMVELNGHNLIKFYNELITSNIVKCYDVFSSAVKDIKGLSNLLTQSIINNERESLDNILAFSLTSDYNFLVPLFEGATEHDSAALILSKFKKRVNKQTIQGGSAVQVSAFGINKVDSESKKAKELKYVCSADDKNVLYAECEVPFDLTVYDSNNQPIKLQFTDYCNPDGTLIMDGDVSKLEKEYPGILDMVAYRIPTEKAYSMLNLKIVRFSHKIAGGTLRVPAQGTTQAGFDFDIDKLYFMRKCFKRKSMELSQDDVDKVWKYAYGKNKDFREALQRERDRYNKEQEEKRKSGTPTSDELIDNLLKTMFSAEDVESVANSEKKNRLYSFWQEASLPGTPQEFFNKYRDEALGVREPFETYDPTKTPWENSKVARDNMLIDLMRARLMDEETLDARVTPQSFDTHSQAARFMRELQFGDLDAITGRSSSAVVSRGWGRFAQNSYEVSSAGDSRFSALNARFASGTVLFGHNVGGRTIESVYQHGVKQGDWTTDNNSKTGVPRSKEIITGTTEDASYEEGYLPLWKEWSKQNPSLIAELREKATGKVLTDKFASSRVSQARALSDIIRNSVAIQTEGLSVNISAIEARLGDKSSDPEPNYDPSDPMTIVTYNQQNQVAGKLIGIFANQNANYALSTLMHTLKLNLGKCKIGFCGHQYDDLLHKDDGMARMVEDNVAGYLAASVDAVKDPVLNFLNLNTLNADAGATLARLGYTPLEIGLLFNQPSVKAICEDCFNNNTGQISEAIDTYMRAYMDAYKAKNNGVEYSYDSSTDGYLTQQVLSDMIVEDRVSRGKNEDLLKTGSRDYLFNQIKVMEQFKNALALSKAVTDFVRVTRFTAANSVGSTLGNIYAQQLAVEDYVKQLAQTQVKDAILDIQLTDVKGMKAPITMTDNSFLTGTEYMKKIYDNPFAYEQCMFDMNRRVIRDLCTSERDEETGRVKRAYYPYEIVPYKSARELLASLCNYDTLDEETINQIHSDLLVFMMNRRLKGSIFDGDALYPYATDESGKNPKNAKYFREIFPKQIFEIRDHLSNVGIPLFEAMSYKTVKLANSGEEAIVLSIEDSSSMQSFQSDAIRDSWEALYYGEYDEFVVGSKEEQRTMAINLFLYNFYKSGFSYTPFSFIHLAPAELKANLSIGSEEYRDEETGEMKRRAVLYKDFLNDLLDQRVFADADIWSTTMQDFAKQFIKNHVDNSRLAYNIRTGTNLYKVFKSKVKVTSDSGIVQESFTVNLSDFEGMTQFLTIPSQCTEDITAFKPCIIIDNFVYMANGNSGMFNTSTDETMEYVRVADIGELDPDDVRNRTLNYTPNSDDYVRRGVKDNSNPSPTPTAPTNPFGSGSSSVEPEGVTLDEGKVQSNLNSAREDLISDLAREVTIARKAAGDIEATIKAVTDEFMAMSEEDLKAQLEAYKNPSRDELNLLVLDKDGKVKPAC